MAEKNLERTYTVPLRKEYMKVPRYKRSKKAIAALKQFLTRHMKSKDVRLEMPVNLKIWKHGIKNPPHHIKVNVTKDEKGIVRAQLFGLKQAVPKKTTKKSAAKKPAKKLEEQVQEKQETPAPKQATKEEPKPEAKTQ